MEIRKFSDIIGVKTTQAIVEGRFVCLTSAPAASGSNALFGLEEDVAGVKLPTDATEAGQAKYVLGWAMDNRDVPIFQPYPKYDWILRNYGLQSGARTPDSDNLPLTGSTLHLTHPSVTVGLTIPSGTLALAYAGGVYTFPSGAFVDNASLRTPGARVAVQYTAGADRGKPMYDASGTIGIVEEFNTTDYTVTIRTLVP